ncbi:hypothetical protein HYN59_14470 [Flavobacterium album]|uniref:Uncharacterized protein n=1 Tax=Flavobacterium album TaxID=2175091 RepID=A0A2S1R0Y3_9FLAO|nr:hypothetical protein HYN59_14470 [Flavobacterium album]
MGKIVRSLKFIYPVVFIYWLVSKFANVEENSFFSVFYEMSSLIVVLITIAIPIFLIVYWFKNRNQFSVAALLLHLLFSIINIVLMISDPYLFK